VYGIAEFMKSSGSPGMHFQYDTNSDKKIPASDLRMNLSEKITAGAINLFVVSTKH
jgi:hypothetical protein